MDSTTTTVLQGTLDLLILKTVAREPMHGWGVSQRMQQVSGGVLDVNQGSLYPALHRLEARGLISSEWRNSDLNRRAKYYRLTTAGDKELLAEESRWKLMVRGIRSCQLLLEGGWVLALHAFHEGGLLRPWR